MADIVVKTMQFQSTHPRGVRPICSGVGKGSVSFNPRTHVGCDAMQVSHDSCTLRFNPRTHVGCDTADTALSKKQIVSIHAPTWGATMTTNTGMARLVFQSTHPRGVRPRQTSSVCGRGCFNPRTHVGCDGKSRHKSYGKQVSIHAPTWGATKLREQK